VPEAVGPAFTPVLDEVDEQVADDARDRARRRIQDADERLGSAAQQVGDGG
jgi:hypothetical protein